MSCNRKQHRTYFYSQSEISTSIYFTTEAGIINLFDFQALTLSRLYTTDVVSSCAFGLATNTASGEENIFLKYGNIMREDSMSNGFTMFVLFFMPKLAKFLNL